MRIPGIVDVYQVGSEWVARSWPRPAKQPNSAAQLLWRQKFANAHAKVSSFTGAYLRSWKAIECPPGKMWIDVAIHSFLMLPGPFNNIPTQQNIKFELYYSASPPGDWLANYALYGNYNALQYLADGPGYTNNLASKWQDVLKWNDDGWICAKGKRPKKKWTLTNVQPYAPTQWVDFPWIGVWPAGEQCIRWFWLDASKGFTFLRNQKWPAGIGYDAGYSMCLPPIYCPVKPWPGAFIP